MDRTRNTVAGKLRRRALLFLATTLASGLLLACGSFLSFPLWASWAINRLLNGRARIVSAQLHTPSLRRLQAESVELEGSGWRLKVKKAEVRYRPADLVRARAESARVEGAELAVELPAGSVAEGAPGSWETGYEAAMEFLGQFAAQPPLRRFLLTNAAVRACRGGEEISFATAAEWSVSGGCAQARWEAKGADASLAFRLAADPASNVKAFGRFRLALPGRWLAFAAQPEALRWPEGIRLDPIEAMLRAELPWSLENARPKLEAEFPPTALEAGPARARIGPVKLTVRLSPKGRVPIAFETPAECSGPFGQAAAARLAGEVQWPDSARLAIEGMDWRGPEGQHAAGGAEIRADELAAPDGPKMEGTVTLSRLSLPGAELEPVFLAFRADRRRAAWSAPSLRFKALPKLVLTNLAGGVEGFLDPEKRIVAEGAAILQPGEGALTPGFEAPCRFQIQAAARGANLSASWEADTGTNRLLSAGLPAPVPLRLKIEGALSKTGEIWRATVKGSAASEKFEAGKLRAEQAEAEWAVSADPARAGRVLENGGKGASGFDWTRLLQEGGLGKLRFALRAAAAGWEGFASAEKVEALISNLPPESPLPDKLDSAELAPSGGRIEFRAGAAALQVLGLELERIRLAGSAGLSEAALDGEAWLGGERFACFARIVSGEAWRGPRQARFGLHGVKLENFELPSELTGAAGSVAATGRIDVEGSASWSPGGTPRIKAAATVSLDRVSLPDLGAELEGVRGRLAAQWAGEWRTAGPQELSIAAVAAGDARLEEARLEAAWDGSAAAWQLVSARFCGGRVWSEPARWPLEAPNWTTTLHLTNVDLAQLAALVPKFHGRIQGRAAGHIPLTIYRDGRWRVRSGRIQLEKGVPAELEYDAEGLLTASLPPDSERYRQMRLVEKALHRLRLQALEAVINDTRQTNLI
ncbi:MAG: YdbH domain-containing protein, partial [Verrucomicrobia bacterium]|nr:YdbH domain-containing protein [Verrucomicrobiota bacterium]